MTTKRPPMPGEAAIIHSTEQTGDVAEIAISTDCFNPEIIALVPEMEDRAIAGYRLRIYAGGFFVIRAADGETLSNNTVARGENGAVLLHTSLISADMTMAEAGLLADLEQCAAIMLTGALEGKQ